MTLKKIIVLSVVTVFVIGFALKTHIVRADGAILLIEKRHISLRDTLVDVRDWNGDEWTDHDEFKEAVLAME